MPAPVTSSMVMTTSFPGAARIFDYAKEMSPPTFDLRAEKFTETERQWDTWIFYQLMGCPVALAVTTKRDLLIQRCISSRKESLKAMISDRPHMSFVEFRRRFYVCGSNERTEERFFRLQPPIETK